MSNAIPRTAADIFHASLQLHEHERSVFIARCCGNNLKLLKEVKSLLAADAKAEGFLESPLCSLIARSLTPTPDPLIGQSIGQYKIEGIIGSGGMGTVYSAIQAKPHRQVAVKVLRAGTAATSTVRRFVHEAEFLSRLHHPAIAHVIEAGWHGGQTGFPYFVMEYISGSRSITKFVKDTDCSTAQRLELLIQVCEAVHHGHQHGIIHRDLKPGNILINDTGEPKIIDFGVAKATDPEVAITTICTDAGRLLGTLRYMSPEQCEGHSRGIDIRCDIYSLGVVLFELLTDELPYTITTDNPIEITRIIREQEPRKLSSVHRSLRGDLETIAYKALEKEPSRRYQSAFELAADIKRYLNSEPIAAERDRTWYVLKKTLHRHRLPVAALVITMFIISASAITLGLMYRAANAHRVRAELAQQQAQTQAEKLRRSVYFNLIALGQNAYESADSIQLNESLAKCPDDLKHWEWYFLNARADESLLTLGGHNCDGVTVASSSDGSRIASGGSLGTLRLWNARTGALLHTVEAHDSRITQVAFSPNREFIASCSADHTTQLWDSTNCKPLFLLRDPLTAVDAFAFSPDSNTIFTGNRNGLVCRWSTETGQLLHSFEAHEDGVISIAINNTGTMLATGSHMGTIRLWQIPSGLVLHSISAHADKVTAIAFDATGKRLYSGSWDQLIKVWDTADAGHLLTYPKAGDSIYSISLSPTQDLLAVAQGTAVEIYSTNECQHLRHYLGHSHTVTKVTFNSAGNTVISSSHDGSIKIWNANRGRAQYVLGSHGSVVEAAAHSPDHRRFATCGRDGNINIYSTDTGEKLTQLQSNRGWVLDLAFSTDSSKLLEHSPITCSVSTAKEVVGAFFGFYLVECVSNGADKLADLSWSVST